MMDMAPALSPQLQAHEQSWRIKDVELDLHGHFFRVSAESRDVFLYPLKGHAF